MHRLLVLTPFLLIVATPSFADRPGFGDTFTFGVGGMQHYADASFQATREGLPPIELDLEDLEMDTDATKIWLGFTWQFADSWGLSGTYTDFDSTGLAFASESGNFDDIEWDVNATLESELDMNIYIVDLHWDFINTGQSHFGVGAGLHIADIKTGIQATLELDVNGDPVGNPLPLGARTTTVTAPLPNFHVRGGHRFGDSIYIGAKLGYFSLKVDEVDGKLVTGAAFAEWRPGGGNFGLGFGYQYMNIDVEQDKSGLFEKYDMTGDGPILYVSAGF